MKKALWISCSVTVLLASCGPSNIDRAQEAAAYKLSDPDSAKFREVRENGEYICGEINGKNQMGAYSGYSQFVAKKAEEGEWEAEIVGDGASEYWFDRCVVDETAYGKPNSCDGSWSAGADRIIIQTDETKFEGNSATASRFLKDGQSEDIYPRIINTNSVRFYANSLDTTLSCNGDKATASFEEYDFVNEYLRTK